MRQEWVGEAPVGRIVQGRIVQVRQAPIAGHLATRRVMWWDEGGIRTRTYRVLVDDALW
ncbi:MAG: hypothetical protein PGN34_13020 [Methylobacterium frigidaeris]